MCDTDTILPVCIRDLKAVLEALPTALEEFACTDLQGVVCLAIPYVTFTDKVRLCRMCFCHTPAGFVDKEHLHPKTVVAIAHVVLKPGTSCAKALKPQACAAHLVFSPVYSLVMLRIFIIVIRIAIACTLFVIICSFYVLCGNVPNFHEMPDVFLPYIHM